MIRFIQINYITKKIIYQQKKHEIRDETKFFTLILTLVSALTAQSPHLPGEMEDGAVLFGGGNVE